MTLSSYRQSLVFAASLSVSLALGGGASRADVAVQRDIGDYLKKAIQLCWVAESAVRAITRCAPFPGLSSYAARYDLWRDVVLIFKPEEYSSDKPLGIEAKELDHLLEKYGKKPD